MAVQRTGVIFAALLLAGALHISTVSAQSSASLDSQTSASSNDANGRASASSRLQVTDGQGSAVAFASSQSFATAKNEIVAIVSRIIDILPPVPNPLDKSSYCPEAARFIEVDAKAIGVAAAKVTVDVVADVIIDGQGNGCSDSSASGEAFAAAFAAVFVDAIVTTGINGINTATAQAILNAKSNAFAAAFASATANACLDGPGFSIAEQTVTAEAVAKPVASILVFLDAFVDCSGFADTFADATVSALLDDVITNVTADGFSDVSGQGDASTTAAAFAVTGRECTGIFEVCCRGRAKGLGNGGTCYCHPFNRKSAAACEATKTTFGDGSSVFDDVNSDFNCACKA